MAAVPTVPMVLNVADSALLAELRAKTETIWRSALGGAHDVAILDAPNQRNAGDSLIWAGEVNYLQRLGVRIRYAADIDLFHPAALRRAMPTGVVLMHGGGNFGDLWAGHQLHRERVARQLPDYRIVVLPQSVFFESDDRAAQGNRILASHPDYLVMVRDGGSMERFRRAMPDVRAVASPDAALGWEPPTEEFARSTGRVLVLARRDRESSSGLAAVGRSWLSGAAVESYDWNPRGMRSRQWSAARSVLSLASTTVSRSTDDTERWFPQRIVLGALNTVAAANIASATRLFRGVEMAVVDRLHAHVLAALLGVPHVVLEQNYGKTRPVFDEYTGGFSTATFASDADAARCLVEQGLSPRCSHS